jgi:hypothetical protein
MNFTDFQIFSAVYYEESPRIQEVLKFNETLQVLVNTDYVNLLLERINMVTVAKSDPLSLRIFISVLFSHRTLIIYRKELSALRRSWKCTICIPSFVSY